MRARVFLISARVTLHDQVISSVSRRVAVREDHYTLLSPKIRYQKVTKTNQAKDSRRKFPGAIGNKLKYF